MLLSVRRLLLQQDYVVYITFAVDCFESSACSTSFFCKNYHVVTLHTSSLLKIMIHMNMCINIPVIQPLLYFSNSQEFQECNSILLELHSMQLTALSEQPSNFFFIFNLLKTNRNLLYIRNQSVPRSKHSPPRL